MSSLTKINKCKEKYPVIKTVIKDLNPATSERLDIEVKVMDYDLTSMEVGPLNDLKFSYKRYRDRFVISIRSIIYCVRTGGIFKKTKGRMVKAHKVSREMGDFTGNDLVDIPEMPEILLRIVLNEAFLHEDLEYVIIAQILQQKRVKRYRLTIAIPPKGKTIADYLEVKVEPVDDEFLREYGKRQLEASKKSLQKIEQMLISTPISDV